MSHKHILAVFVCCMLLSTISLYAQRQFGGVPYSLDNVKISKRIESSPAVDASVWYKKSEKKRTAHTPNILALPLLTKKEKSNTSLNKFENHDGGRVWTQRITLPESTESYLRLSDYEIPRGGRLYIIADEGRQVLGAYTDQNTNAQKTFFCGPIRGAFTIEYDSPSGGADGVPFRVAQIYAGASDIGALASGFGTSYDCMVNVNCDEGSAVEKEKRAVVRIRVVGDEAVYLCTGSLMNNTSGDRTPYVLSSYHCERPPEGDFTPRHELWTFDFRYEASSCVNPGEEPTPVTVQGSEKVAEYEGTDMLLLRVTAPIPIEANPYYLGWDRSENVPTSSTIVHHPSGDIKKVTMDGDAAGIDTKERQWDNGTITYPESHFTVDFDNSTFMGGSSGSALLNEDNLAVGILHGGPGTDEFCTSKLGYFGRISKSWDSGESPSSRLRDWLDPTGTGAESVAGIDAAAQSQITTFKGKVVTPDGIAISNVLVDIAGDSQGSIYTGRDGRFIFDNLSTKGRFKFNLSKEGDHANGVSALDIVLIKNHLLGRKSLDNVYARYAADVSLDGKISSLDIVHIINVILTRWDEFPGGRSWGFEPYILEASGSDLSSDSEYTIIGFKLGDVNLSANPRK